jgi:Ca-activated chloride channel homolog
MTRTSLALAFAAALPISAATGSLVGLDNRGEVTGECPLKHTDVKAEITGFLARVTVTQEFENTAPDKIEAVYTFPLSAKSAVDDMTMHIGDRVVKGTIKKREEARAIYEAARDKGHLASLLDQERPNIFTQSVANIMPGAKVKITISYVELIQYEHGAYDFRFPMVVAPRYISGRAIGKDGGGWSPDTHRVPDASRITPHVAPPGTRAGHDISVEVKIDAGVPVENLQSPTHDVAVDKPGASQAVVRLKDKAVIPNKDFLLKYAVAGQRIDDAVLAHRGSKGGFFTLILQPPARVPVATVTPRELVFVLDTSGSMSGFPIEKAKEAMKLAIDGLREQDTFNLITFAGDTHILFPEPVRATPENLRRAQVFLRTRSGSGGTEMMKAIRASLEGSDQAGHVRVVCFMTDGEVGNDMEIISEVQRHPNARVFAFGIGSSVNHFLLDKMAQYGRGEVDYVGLNDDGSTAARRFHERIDSPVLTDIAIDWNGIAVSDVYPARVPDLFAAKPVVVYGRYAGPARGSIRLRGKVAGKDFSREVKVDLPAAEPKHDVLATLWARTRVDDLMGQDYYNLQRGTTRDDIRKQITDLGLQFRLMTQFTSFVAVEEMTVTEGGKPRRVEVPVEMPEGMSYQGVFGRKQEARMMAYSTVMPARSFGGFAGTVRMKAARPAEPPQPGSKLDPSLQALVNRQPVRDEPVQAQNGKVSVQLFLNDTSAETLKQLQQAGFEVVLRPQSGKVLVGRIAVEKLTALAQIEAIKYIAPHRL